jgi:hypothetical protein
MSRRKPIEWEEKFLKLYANNGNVTLSARGCAISRMTVYDRRNNHPDFAARMYAARAEAVEMLEAEAWARARKQSDTLLIFLLKSLRPDVYRETVRQEHTGADGGALEIIIRHADS